MTDLTPEALFVADVTAQIRRSLFARLRDKGFSSSELTAIVASATRAAVRKANLPALAGLAVAAAPVVEALEAVEPEDPAAAAWRAVRDSAPEQVRALFTDA